MCTVYDFKEKETETRLRKMATKGEPFPEKQRRHSNSGDIGINHLTCAVCLDQYDRPKLLPCFHTFCQSCLESVAAASGKQDFRCPACRTPVPLPRGGVADLQANFYIQKDLDMVNPSMRCDVCNEKTETTYMCLSCYQRYCFNCKGIHNNIKSCQGHRIITLAAGEGRRKGEGEEEWCSEHGDQRLLLYCMQCSSTICLLCKLTLHEGHPTCDRDAAIDSMAVSGADAAALGADSMLTDWSLSQEIVQLEFSYSEDRKAFIFAVCPTCNDWLWVKYCAKGSICEMKLFDEEGNVVQVVNKPVAGFSLATVLDDLTISRGTPTSQLDMLEPLGEKTSVSVDLKPAYIVQGAACGYPFLIQDTAGNPIVRLKFSSKNPLRWTTEVVLKENTLGKLMDVSAEEKYFVFRADDGMLGALHIYHNLGAGSCVRLEHVGSYRTREADVWDCRFCIIDGREMLLVICEGNRYVHVIDHTDEARFVRNLDTRPMKLRKPHCLATDYNRRVWIGCHGGRVVVVDL